MSNQLAVMKYDDIERFGNAMVASGYFSDTKKISQAIVKIQTGQELGLPPIASITGIHIIKGKPTIGANLIATMIKNDSRYDYKVREMTNDKCTLEFFEGGQSAGVSEFTAEDADKAGTQNMGKFPRNMLFARAISNGARWYTPGIFGGVAVYTPEEMGGLAQTPLEIEYGIEEITEDGEIIAATFDELPEPEPEPEKTQAPEDETAVVANHLQIKRRAFHATGTERYGDAWDDKRPQLVAAVKPGSTSSNDLDVSQLQKLIGGMEALVK